MAAGLSMMGGLSWDGFTLVKLGSAVEAVLLSLALASRINGLTRDRERAQREILAAKTARIEALRQLVSGVAHEVGNPLNFACGGSDELDAQLVAIERNVPGSGASAQRAHRLVASGLTRIKLILDNLRRYLSVGDADTVPTELAHEIDQALELTAERLTCAGVRVDNQIAPLPVLHARPGELHQVMLNLIANAIEAMPGGGTLRVTARAGDREVEVAMTDTGSGIDAADREKIFEPFFTTRRAAGGTGLGLAVAREIVMRHGGTIRVEAGDGGGARFVVSLPRVQEAGDR
jgi:signal transduction histidine kinase